MSQKSCSECGTHLSVQAETCPECGYPAITYRFARHVEIADPAPSTHKEYKFIQLLGISVVAIGVVAALLDSTIAAAVSISIGAATYITGLLGQWWNRGD